MINVNVNVNVNVNAVDLEKKPFGEDVSKRDGFDDYSSTEVLIPQLFRGPYSST